MSVPESGGVFHAAPAETDDANDQTSQVPAAAVGAFLKVAIATLGCKVNQYESAAMAECLTGAGYRLVDYHAAADCYIINTCTVTNGADYQSRQLIRRAQRLNPQAAIIVTGCYAQTTPHVFAGMPGVAVVVGTEEKHRMSCRD